MELDERKMKILQAIVKNNLETGEPVGSRTISKYTDLNLSSATIRNEMADLEEQGYILQPHTSAGRIPSDKGYRVYVDEMMKERETLLDSRAISDFKETKQKQSAQQASDSNELKQKVADAEKLAKTAQVELEATYLLKMADFDTAWEKDGKLSAKISSIYFFAPGAHTQGDGYLYQNRNLSDT